ncbi:nuclear transport factor 2 family protein [Nocardioides sp. zg-579]|uniref:Nuclear transport factor 2 family protein n=1 Tax=Nocardioides marmotae TaxID=2663857 RepID=A0A6I3J8J5_9ACTN|nr:nuclear transport factor 2 family protein [Nocardioides marmotae]MCR6031221.1 nuclear transport factor 2 family protein [Gordonia jinghuaiqii]MTB94859.1 nuclear transport factor 2 family protein [Nocardioides marmotae]QKE01159.1 nuclear transport factor 2 family protein [Nocardioides marmotae]
MSIEERLQRLEDVVAITQLVASYGPLVDAGEAERVADLWTEQGVYDVDELYMGSRAEVDAMVRSDAHQGLIGNGCSHFLGPAHVAVDGDRAVAVCESVLLVRRGDRVFPARIGANHFDLVRTPDGWRTTRRTTRGLDGSADARDLLSRTGRL